MSLLEQPLASPQHGYKGEGCAKHEGFDLCRWVVNAPGQLDIPYIHVGRAESLMPNS